MPPSILRRRHEPAHLQRPKADPTLVIGEDCFYTRSIKPSTLVKQLNEAQHEHGEEVEHAEAVQRQLLARRQPARNAQALSESQVWRPHDGAHPSRCFHEQVITS